MLKFKVRGKNLICFGCSANVNYVYIKDEHHYCQDCAYPQTHLVKDEENSLVRACPKCDLKSLYRSDDNDHWFCVECLWESLPSYMPDSKYSGYSTKYSWEEFPVPLAIRRRLSKETITLDGNPALLENITGMVAHISVKKKDYLFIWPVVQHVIEKENGVFLSRQAL